MWAESPGPDSGQGAGVGLLRAGCVVPLCQGLSLTAWLGVLNALLAQFGLSCPYFLFAELSRKLVVSVDFGKRPGKRVRRTKAGKNTAIVFLTSSLLP